LGTIQTAVGLAEDLHKGFIERFRSLPMASSAVLVGRTFADMARNVVVVLLMVAVGYLVGFRIQTNVFGLVGAIGVLLAFSFAMSWVFANMGLRAPSAEAAQAGAFPVLMPLVFASTAFVPLVAMPHALQVFARNQPVSVTVKAVRVLVLDSSQRIALYHDPEVLMPVLASLLWAAGLVAVFAPLAVRRYRRTA
jgi:ABC transporter DrrB family efflux protein